MNIVFVTNGNPSIGFGHISRTLTLYSYFKKHNHYTKIIVPESCTFYENEDFIKAKSFSKKDLSFIEQDFNVIIIDSIEDDFDALSWLEYTKLFVVSITLFLFAFSKRYEHLSFYPSIQEPEIVFTGKTQIYLGKQYLTFREEFKKANFIVRENANKVLVTMGGTDPFGLTLRVIEALKNDRELLITVLLSEKSNDFQKLSEISKLYPNISLIGFTKDMARLLTEHDIAVINGGLTRYEACVVGIPFIALSFHKKQFRITQELVNFGVGINLGVYNTLSQTQIYKVVRELLENSHLRKMTSSKMIKLIDTKGVERIYNIVNDKFKEYEANNEVV